jgi:hypothetical protein
VTEREICIFVRHARRKSNELLPKMSFGKGDKKERK